MKTWEMIKELTENPKKEFRHNTCVGDYFIAKTTNDEEWFKIGQWFID